MRSCRLLGAGIHNTKVRITGRRPGRLESRLLAGRQKEGSACSAVFHFLGCWEVKHRPGADASSFGHFGFQLSEDLLEGECVVNVVEGKVFK